MNDHNGIVARIKRVLDSHDIEDQKLINSLILEALAANSQQLDNIRNEAKGHAKVHSKTDEEHSSRLEEWQEAQRKFNKRLEALENIVFFPSRHPKRAVGLLLGVLFLINLWFISGFREMFLRMLNAPDWLITFLVPGAMP
jgi:hypothetical protein